MGGEGWLSALVPCFGFILGWGPVGSPGQAGKGLWSHVDTQRPKSWFTLPFGQGWLVIGSVCAQGMQWLVGPSRAWGAGHFSKTTRSLSPSLMTPSVSGQRPCAVSQPLGS